VLQKQIQGQLQFIKHQATGEKVLWRYCDKAPWGSLLTIR